MGTVTARIGLGTAHGIRGCRQIARRHVNVAKFRYLHINETNCVFVEKMVCSQHEKIVQTSK